MADDITVKFAAELGNLQSGLSAAARGLGDTAQSMRESAAEAASLSERFDSLTERAKQLFEVLAVREGIRFVTDVIKSGLEGAEALQQMAARTGEGVQALSRIKFAADATGVSFDRFSLLVGTLDAKLLQLRATSTTGGGSIGAAFRDLGIDPAKLTSATQAIDAVAGAVTRFGSTAQVIGDVREIFGRMGQDLLILAPRLQELEEKSDLLGATLRAEVVANATLAKEAFNELGAVWDAAKINIAAGIAPELHALAGYLTELAQSVIRFASDGTLESWAREAAVYMCTRPGRSSDSARRLSSSRRRSTTFSIRSTR